MTRSKLPAPILPFLRRRRARAAPLSGQRACRPERRSCVPVEREAARAERARTTVADVQLKTGLDFFWDLPNPLEVRIEAEMAPYWLEAPAGT
jgi:hypothetical protein